jgi:hypothetical protein
VAYARLFPADKFDPNILILTDGMGVVKAVGPLGLVYLASLGTFEIKQRRIRIKGTDKQIRGKSLFRNGEWGYQAIALHWSLPSARVAEAILHPDYYSHMSLPGMIRRTDSLLKRFLTGDHHSKMAAFFKWFDKAFDHVSENHLRDLYKTKDMVISSKPKEYGFFPYAFRSAQDITLKDFYERKDKRTG